MVVATETPLPKGIGSVIPAADAGGPPPSGPTVWSAWTAGQADIRAYATARAALTALLITRGIRRLWLPAYGCRALLESALAAGVVVAWYGVDDRLAPDVNTVRAGLAKDDAVLAIAWFGRAPDATFQTLANDHPGTLIIEDRAQALAPGGGIDGAVRLYSPRKLLGVADGGLLVGRDLPPPAPLPPLPALWLTNDARRADPDGLAPSDWFPAYQSREATFDTAPRGCSDRTLAALDLIDLEHEANARRQNWRVLAESLDRLALWSIPDPEFAPLGFPVVVAEAAALVAHLAERRIWAARHWADLPCPDTFTTAHDLARRCVSLPLDGRYGPDDMQWVADAVLAFAAHQTVQADGAR